MEEEVPIPLWDIPASRCRYDVFRQRNIGLEMSCCKERKIQDYISNHLQMSNVCTERSENVAGRKGKKGQEQNASQTVGTKPREDISYAQQHE